MIRTFLRDLFRDEPVRSDLPLDAAVHLMSNERRRLAVELIDALGPMELKVLADAFAAISDIDRKGAYVTLYQTHLPKLDKHDVIELGDRGHHIEPGEHFNALVKCISDLEERFEIETDSSQVFEFDEDDAVAEIAGDA
ncbi:DUF7344 domain-containing protein [Natrinema halophilum]|uniref:DUF7344 domain-containing protein n=1 Tax=Natrinema halophilum TaxID=1699371 RepID=UPI001F3000A0|nr:hypothetical protein [Natrinema halophilum]UHQ96428.1 hypothetical protein HYG82_23595 [Natrinema halophilum]